jgi:hypothetical protein
MKFKDNFGLDSLWSEKKMSTKRYGCEKSNQEFNHLSHDNQIDKSFNNK